MKKNMKLDDVYVAMYSAFRDQVDPRRAQELKDSRMIQEDPKCVANLPERFIHREFSSNGLMEHIGQYNDEVE